MIFVIVGCILENIYVNSTFDEITYNLQSFKTRLEGMQYEDIDTQENINLLTYYRKDFHKKEQPLKALIWHTGLKDVEIGISRILTYVEQNNYNEAMVETNALIDYCLHYSQDFDINLQNIL